MYWSLNSVNLPTVRLEVAGITHVGMKRTHNEDNYLLLPEEALLCVADGMGGHSSGEIARADPSGAPKKSPPARLVQQAPPLG